MVRSYILSYVHNNGPVTLDQVIHHLQGANLPITFREVYSILRSAGFESRSETGRPVRYTCP